MTKANFLHDPHVLAALDLLSQAIIATSGTQLKNILLVAKLEDAGPIGVAYHGCTCSNCATAMLTSAGRAFKADTPITVASAEDFARQVH